MVSGSDFTNAPSAVPLSPYVGPEQVIHLIPDCRSIRRIFSLGPRVVTIGAPRPFDPSSSFAAICSIFDLTKSAKALLGVSAHRYPQEFMG
jgi:hypothetical protein